MKKRLMMAVLVTLGVTNAVAQGQIYFGNNPAYPLIADISPAVSNVVGTALTAYGLGPASVRIGLLVGANGGALSSMVPVVAANNGDIVVTNSPLTNEVLQGTFGGDNSPLPSGHAWSDGLSPIQFAYVAWEIQGSEGIVNPLDLFTGNYFTPDWTFYVGWSGVVTGYMPGHDVVIAPATFGTGPGQLSYPLNMVLPEPGTFALAVLGAAAFLLFRRRR